MFLFSKRAGPNLQVLVRNRAKVSGAVWLLALGLCNCSSKLGPEGAPPTEANEPSAGGTGSGGSLSSMGGEGAAPSGPADTDVLMGNTPTDVELDCDAENLAENPLLKLSTVQYRNTVADLLARYALDSVEGEVAPLLSAIPDDSLGDSFRGLDDRVDLNHVQGYFRVGVAIGDAIAEDPDLRAQLLDGCADEWSSECVDELAAGFLRTVYRRPLSDDELQGYRTLLEAESDPAQAVRAAVIVGMSSPRFVYHLEVNGEEFDQSSDLLHVDAYELASRLSYTFWQTMPDEELMAAAADGSLLDEETYQVQLARVWEDERTRATLAQFWTEWLKLEKFTGFETQRPAFQALSQGLDFEAHDYYSDMVDELQQLIELVTFEQPGSLGDLLATPLSVTQSPQLAELYGVEAWDGEGEFPRFDQQQRAGLLQRAALLVSNLEQTNPFHRGALIRRSILCDSLLQPDTVDLPPGSLDLPPVDMAQTTRERFGAKVEGNGLCETCHQVFSDIGYVLESYDALGRFRTTELVFDEQSGELLAELPIDTQGSVAIVTLSDPPVADAGELNQAIIDSGKVEACLAQNYLSFVARRAQEAASIDACVIQDLSEMLSESEGGLERALRQVASFPTFFVKKVGEK